MTVLLLWLAAPLVAAPTPPDVVSQAARENAARAAAELHIEANEYRSVETKLDQPVRNPNLVQRLESCLLDAWEQAEAQGALRAAKSLSDSSVQVQGSNVIVIVQCPTNANPMEVAALIAMQKGNIIRAGEAHVKAVVPILALDQIANLPGVSFVRTPIRPRANGAVMTEGRAATLATAWHAAGFMGQGVKVAVIDGDFAGLTSRQASDEIPASAIVTNFSTEAIEEGSGHGCACAEVIYDVAPGVQMYLIKSLDPSDAEAAVNYCKAQGVQIISQSAGYETVNFHDGVAYSSILPHPVAIANDAVANGILWVNSAGNEQLQHAMTEWRDGNATGTLDWAPSSDINMLWSAGQPVQIPAGEKISGYLTWNEWPTTDQNFDLHLCRFTGTGWTKVAAGTNYQTGTQSPRERIIDFTVSIAGEYGFAVVKRSATRSPTFILRSYPYSLRYKSYNNEITPCTGSINIPADAASVFAVGAIRVTNYTSGPIEWFSSLGPNNGRFTGQPTALKPDICGPDYVSTATRGSASFRGTSASAPHIAALAALIKSAYPTYSNSQLRSYLEGCGKDLGDHGKDNTYGSGPCVLPAPNPPPSITTSSPLPSGTVGEAYSTTLAAISGTPPYSWGIASNSLPPGLTLSIGGEIAGTPILATNASCLVRVTGSNGLFAQKLISLMIEAPEPWVYAWTNLAGLPTFAGTNDGALASARFYYPAGVAVDGEGNLLVADTGNHAIRKVTPAGDVTIFAGSPGDPGTNDGASFEARFCCPEGLAVDAAGNVFVADTVNNTIRKVTSAGDVMTLAGLPETPGTDDGTGSAARFYWPRGVAVDGEGNVFVADSGNHTIRKVSLEGEVSTLVGLAGASGTNDGTGDTARFYLPFGVAADNAGDVFVTDFCNHTIRKVTSAGEVTTLAGLAGVNGTYDGTGSAARFDSPAGVAVDALGNLFVADRRNHTIRKVTSEGVVTTLAGNPGASGTNDGFGSRARFMFPRGVAVDTAGNLFVADTENHRIIKGTILCPMITPVFDGKNLHLSWPARFLGWELQEQPYPLNEASGADWSVVTGSRMTNHMYLPIDPVNPGVFYRLHFP